MASTKPATTVTEHEAKQPGSQPKSLWEIIPWTGLASLVIMGLCAIATATVVGVASGKIASSWSIQPAVILAILSAISNIAFNSAMATGIAVRFWLYASRDAHLSQLHYIWDHGRGFGFLSALRAGSEARTVAVLATIAYITQFASGPLVQRSVEQTVTLFESAQSIKMDVATHIPDGWFGQMESDHVVGQLNGIPQQQAIERNLTMYTRANAEHPGYTCNGTCHAHVQGAGFSYQCSTSHTFLNMTDKATDGTVVFAVNGSRVRKSADQTYLVVNMVYVSDVNTSCISTLTTTTCNIDAAVVEYPVTVANSTITLRNDELPSMRTVSNYYSENDLPDRPDDTPSGPLVALAGLVANFGNPLWTQVNKTYIPGTNKSSSRTRYNGASTALADIFIQLQRPAYADENGPMRKCALAWADPTEYVLGYMHEYMFRSALRIGMNGTSLLGVPPGPDEVSEHQQTLQALQVTPQSIFVITPSYLGAGIAAMVIATGLVVALMWGWWRLRRSVTLSPLETVTALVDAPQLRDMSPDTTLRQILSRVDTGTATGSVRSGESARSPAGFALRKTLTSRSNSSSQNKGTGFSPRPLKKASTFAGTESVSRAPPPRPQREDLRTRTEVEPARNNVMSWSAVSVDEYHPGVQVGR